MKKISVTILLATTLAMTAAAGVPSHEPFTRLLKKHVSNDGRVNYKAFMADSAALANYLNLLSANPPDKTWSRNEQIAFWINAYNAFTIKLILRYYPIKSIKDIGSNIQIPFVNTPWDIKFIRIGKDRLDLNNIEHGILRKRFDDPRIHMALVCASKSCPVLLNEAYEPSKLDDQLTQQTTAFLTDTSRNQITSNDPKISMIFKWYAMDFDNVRTFINKYSPTKISATLEMGYLEYDWTLNE
jgi:hypothetical protein